MNKKEIEKRTQKNWEEKGWQKYPPGVLKPDCEHFYQKIITRIDDKKIGANIYVYKNRINPENYNYELEIQIPDVLNVIGETINLTVFTYGELDFGRIEGHAKEAVNSLIKK